MIDSTQVWREMQIGHHTHRCGRHPQLSVYSDVYRRCLYPLRRVWCVLCAIYRSSLLTYLYWYSNGGGILSAFIDRLRISSVCSCDVLCARVWERGHGTRRDSHRRRLSCVSVLLLDDALDRFTWDLDPGFSGISEKEYGTQVVVPSDEDTEASSAHTPKCLHFDVLCRTDPTTIV
jgi:hypothetical protein